jgi:hypothetical protein
MAPVEAIGHVTRRQQEDEPGQEEREASVPEVDGAMSDGVHLPRHGDRLRLGAENHRYARQLVSPEITGGKGLKSAPRRLRGIGRHHLLSGYNGQRECG